MGKWGVGKTDKLVLDSWVLDSLVWGNLVLCTMKVLDKSDKKAVCIPGKQLTCMARACTREIWLHLRI